MPGLIFIKVRRKSCSKLNFLAGPVHVPLRAKNCWKGEGIFGVSLSVCFVPLQYCMFWALGRRYPNKHLNAWVDGRPVLNFTSNSLVNCSNRMGMVVEGSFSSSFKLSDVAPWASSFYSPTAKVSGYMTFLPQDDFVSPSSAYWNENILTASKTQKDSLLLGSWKFFFRGENDSSRRTFPEHLALS